MALREQLEKHLSGSYRIERELSGGGMSRVFLAEEQALGRRVVIKVLPPELSGGINFQRFEREIQLAAALQHPHIVPVFAAGNMDGIPFFTMPFVEGESLRATLARGELPVAEATSILRDVCRALVYAHARGVVHRDIKPDNVLLSSHSAAVTDFGVAKALTASTSAGDALTATGIALGTPAYMSPEQAAADPNIDARADIYAVGALGYEMLMRRHRRRAQDVGRARLARAKQVRPRIRQGRSSPYRGAAWRKAEAVRLLNQAMAAGAPFDLGFHAWHADPAFAPLRDFPPFKELLRPK